MNPPVPHIDTRLAQLASRQSLQAQCDAYRECRVYSPHFARIALSEPAHPPVRRRRESLVRKTDSQLRAAA